jgi:hypothetical protein
MGVSKGTAAKVSKLWWPYKTMATHPLQSCDLVARLVSENGIFSQWVYFKYETSSHNCSNHQF